MSTTVIANARIVQTMPPFSVSEGVDVVVKNDTIVAVGKNAAASYPGARIIDGSGKTVIPGMVCSHHHYYSGLSRGMLISAGLQNDFIQVLKEWWWRLDRGLDEEACYYSSLICSIDAIAAGTTSCIDHHASPAYIAGSLDTIAKGMREVGVRGATCYEVTDRNGGMEEIRRGVEENIRFAKSVDAERKIGKKPLVEAMIGGHAPFTVPDEGLAMMASACRETGRGIHFHVAEDKYDVTWSHHMHNADIIDRLDHFGLLADNSLLVHGLWLNPHEIEVLNTRGCFLAHNPRSNMNNHVGYCQNLCQVENLVLGTDGCGGNMFEELKIAYFKHKDEGGPWWPGDFLTALTRGNRLLERYFGEQFGRVEPGYKADLVMLDYNSPTPWVDANAAGHFVWGISSNSVHSVMVEGKLVMENRQFPFDVKEIYAKAAEVASRVWAKVDKIAP
ncbi:MAG: putative aminohydrolase SsnA [Sphaerochaetaceae bacterium]